MSPGATEDLKHAAAGILTSDWHMHGVPPAFRESEPDWFRAMSRPVGEILALANHLKCPVFLAGDVFHKATEPPELVNWLIQKILSSGVKVYGVPGQHDLENHVYENIKRTSYWTLVEAGALIDVKAGYPMTIQHREGVFSVTLHPFPWRTEPKPFEGKAHDFNLDVAMVHRYYWSKDENKHPRAADTQCLSLARLVYADYDAVVIGDNHKHLMSGNVFGPGTLMRRRSDEMEYKPCVGILYQDGTISRHYLDVSQDKYGAVKPGRVEEGDQEVSLSGFMESLSSLGTSVIDFAESAYVYLESHQPEIAQKIKDRVIAIVSKKR